MAVAYPVIGSWYRRANGALFEVVAVDEDDRTIELQFFDGTIDEVEFEAWQQLLLEKVDAPEDWSGSVDMDPEDFIDTDGKGNPDGVSQPLDFLDRTE